MALLLAVSPCAAQYTEDERTQDHAERDRRYRERYVDRDEPPTAGDREAEIEAYLAQADELIRDRNYRSAVSEHYRVQTDDPRLDPQAAAALLEAFRVFFEGFFGERLALRPHDERTRVFLFYSFAEFNRLLDGDYRYSELRPRGHYGSLFDVILLHTDPDGGTGDVGDALVHEAAHQQIDRRLFAADGRPVPWLAEGLASYFGFLKVDPSLRFEPGRPGDKRVGLYRSPRARAGRQRQALLAALRRAWKTAGDAPWVVEDVVSIESPARFYGQDTAVHYAVSWVLVHYLLHGDDGRHRPAFLRFLEQASRGAPDARSVYAAIGMDAAALEAALRRHVRTMGGG